MIDATLCTVILHIHMSTRLFLDSGDPEKTRALLKKEVLLAGQTTNPSLVAKNPEVHERVEADDLFTKAEINDLYREIVTEISELVDESVSIEVYADFNTRAEEMLEQAREMNQWIPNAHVKLPTIHEGLRAAEVLAAEGVRLNLTLCFTQQQAAAVYAATRGAPRGNVFVSPFIGRYDDTGQNGLDIVRNIQQMYAEGDGHVEVLAASIRNQEHLKACYHLGVDIITAPWRVLDSWANDGFPMPEEFYAYPTTGLETIPYEDVSLEEEWQYYNLDHQLVHQGVDKFVADWKKLLK